MLLAYGYTFSKNSGIRRGGSRFACSKFLSKNCKAVVHVDKNNVILKAVYDHNHDPPEYTIQDGVFIKTPSVLYRPQIKSEISGSLERCDRPS